MLSYPTLALNEEAAGNGLAKCTVYVSVTNTRGVWVCVTAGNQVRVGFWKITSSRFYTDTEVMNLQVQLPPVSLVNTGLTLQLTSLGVLCLPEEILAKER